MTCIFLQPYVLSSTFVPLELNVLSMPKSIHTLSHSSFKIHFSYKSFSDPLPTQTMLGSLPQRSQNSPTHNFTSTCPQSVLSEVGVPKCVGNTTSHATGSKT